MSLRSPAHASAIILLLLFLAAFVSAQEAVAGGESLLDPSVYLSLTVKDIDSADLYQLVDWCRLLDLDHRGNIETLRRRLYNHYGFAPSTDTEPGEKEPQRLTIRSADTTRYFTLESRDEGYVEISGSVVLELYSPAEGSRHTIEAERLLYNQNTGDMSAAGSVRYTLEEGENQEETFYGETLTVNLENWESRFLKGFTLQNRSINEKEITFTFYGDSIARSQDEIIFLKDGRITSSTMEDPSYRIDADEIWVYEPGEWLLNGATFYVGRVPMLIFPFFFQLRDKMIVNPAFGFKLVEGAFIQTSTYFFGARPKSDEASLSFLQLTEEDNAAGVTEIKGLYRRTKSNPAPEEIAAARRAEEQNEYGRVILDYYNRLGLAAALDISLADRGFFGQIDLFAGAGITRVVSGFAPYQFTWIDPDENGPRSVWEGAWLGSVYIPMRLYNRLSLRGNGGGVNIELDLPFNTDPRIAQLYEDRRESIDWGELLAITDQPDSDSSTTLPTGFNWKLKTDYRADTGKLAPLITEFRLQEMSVDLGWKYGTLSGTDSEIEQLLPQWDAVPSYLQDEYASRYFIYPESLVLPRLSLNLTGRLLPLTDSGADEKKGGGPDNEELVPPWERSNEDQEENETYVEDLTVPSLIDAYAIDLNSDQAQGHTLSYRLNPRLTQGINFDVLRWDDGETSRYTSPEQVDFDPAYTLTTLAGDARLNYNGHYYNKLWSIEDSLGFTFQQKQRASAIESSIPTATWDSLTESDKLGSYQRLSHSFLLSNRPFIHSAVPVDQLLEYRLQHYLYTHKYEAVEGYRSDLFPWERESIQEQRVTSTTGYQLGSARQTVKLESTLPPLLGEIDAHYTSRAAKVLLNASGGFEEIDDNRWEPKDATLQGKYSFNDYSFIRQQLLFAESDQRENFRLREGESEAAAATNENSFGLSSRLDYLIAAEDDSGRIRGALPESFYSRAWAGAFWTSFEMEYIYPLTLVTGTGWVQDATRDFIPSEYSFGYKKEVEHDPLWKRRVSLAYGVDTGYTQDLNRYSDTTFFIKSSLNLSVYQFLDLQFSALSENTAAFRYLPWLINGTDIEGVNPVADLFRSFNLFNVDDRRRSNFNLKSIDLKAVHHLDQWDLTLEYTGEPVQDEQGGYPIYRWESNFSIYVQWNPIPELKQEVNFDDGELRF